MNEETHAKARRREGIGAEGERLAAILVDACIKIHRELGPGLLESVYEVVLAHELRMRGCEVARQVPVPVIYQGLQFEEGFRADIIVDGRLLVELKSVERLAPVHKKQVLTYLRLMRLPLGFLVNFGEELMKTGIHRVINNCRDS
jgi:iron complex transport system substrate-binding protein